MSCFEEVKYCMHLFQFLSLPFFAIYDVLLLVGPPVFGDAVRGLEAHSSARKSLEGKTIISRMSMLSDH